jgi:diguanylate cyclase (GGDEF)-like protein
VLGFLSQVVDVDLLAIGLAEHREARFHHSRPPSARSPLDLDAACGYLAARLGVAPGSVPVVQVDGSLEGRGERAVNADPLPFDLTLRDARGCLVAWPRQPSSLAGPAGELLAKTAPHVALVLDNVRLAEKLWALSTHDELTGLLNHRAVHARLAEEAQRVGRYGGPMSIALCDIDRFKGINDRFGHPTGDRVLREVADRLRSGLRSTDVIGRYGGEEFLIIFPSTELEAACLASARLSGALASRPFVIGLDLEPVVVTASFGVACTLEDPSDRPQLEGLVSSADRRLYEAKAAGRCCIRP